MYVMFTRDMTLEFTEVFVETARRYGCDFGCVWFPSCPTDPMVCKAMARAVRDDTCVVFLCAPTEAMMAALVKHTSRAVRFQTKEAPLKGFKSFVDTFVAGTVRVSYVDCHPGYLVVPRRSFVDSVYIKLPDAPAQFVRDWLRQSPERLRVHLDVSRKAEFDAPGVESIWAERGGRGVWAARLDFDRAWERRKARDVLPDSMIDDLVAGVQRYL